MNTSTQSRGRYAWLLAGILWLLTLAIGMGILAKYTYTPGRQTIVQSLWPAATKLRLDAELPTLVIFAHSRCPCTRASIYELGRLVARAEGRAKVTLVVVSPPGETNSWQEKDVFQSAASIPGVRLVSDDGAEARLFGAETSGQTLLYDRSGKVLFHGGITIARGHAGDNEGERLIVELLHGRAVPQAESPVFGCPIFESPDAQQIAVAGDPPTP